MWARVWGYRLATSTGGVLAGRGTDIIVIDDPLKPEEALSEAQRHGCNDWYDHTLYSRLNDKQRGAIIIVMQRLHEEGQYDCLRRLAAVNYLGALPVRPLAVAIIGSAAGRSLGQNGALRRPINRFVRDVAVGVIRQWDRRGDADRTAQQDIQRD
jgi:hypothetical protein